MERYLSRIYDSVLSWRLKTKGAVLVEGPKWCGKTTTAKQLAKSTIYLQNPTTRAQNLTLARIAPDRILAGPTPRLIDEWQDAPQLWDAVRFEVDRRDAFGQFILTGSSVPPNLDEIRHSGTGRIARLKMRPMSLYESEDSTGEVSLKELFDGKMPFGSCPTSIEDLSFLICRGGWPRAVGNEQDVVLQQAFDYLDAIVEVDISRVDDVRRNPSYARHIMRSYSRMIASQGSLASMQADLNQSGIPLGENTFLEYVEALRKLFVIEDLGAWNPNLRSKTAIRTSPTRHFIDPSIAVAALGANPESLINDLETCGLLFESMCVRDLRIYAEPLNGTVYHYRDKSGLECDAVVVLRDGSYGLIEVKLGGDRLIDEGARNLKALAAKIDTSRMSKPAFLAVLTGVGELSYPREDGILVIPIRTLKD